MPHYRSSSSSSSNRREGIVVRHQLELQFVADVCSGCGICEDRCQFHAIAVNGVAVVDGDKCYGCGNCVITCPDEALTLEEVRPVEHIRVK